MVSVTGEIDPVASLSALTASISANLPPISGATTAAAAMAAATSLSLTSSLSLPLSSSLSLPLNSDIIHSSPSPISFSPSAANEISLSPADHHSSITATLQVIHHLLNRLNLHPKDIATLLSSSPPLSAAASFPAAAAATHPIAGRHSPLIDMPSSSAHPLWQHSNPNPYLGPFLPNNYPNPNSHSNPNPLSHNSAASPHLHAAALHQLSNPNPSPPTSNPNPQTSNPNSSMQTLNPNLYSAAPI